MGSQGLSPPSPSGVCKGLIGYRAGIPGGMAIIKKKRQQHSFLRTKTLEFKEAKGNKVQNSCVRTVNRCLKICMQMAL